MLACNFFAPYLTYTSNLVNVSDPCGYIPTVVNPECSRTPNPYLLITGITGFLIPGAAMVFGVIAGRIHRRWPGHRSGRHVAELSLERSANTVITTVSDSSGPVNPPKADRSDTHG